MRLYLVRADKYNYDQFDAHVIRAATPERAEELARLEDPTADQKWTATRLYVDGQEEVILGSYNAG